MLSISPPEKSRSLQVEHHAIKVVMPRILLLLRIVQECDVWLNPIRVPSPVASPLIGSPLPEQLQAFWFPQVPIRDVVCIFENVVLALNGIAGAASALEGVEEVLATAVAESIGVVCWGAVRNSFGRTGVGIAEGVSLSNVSVKVWVKRLRYIQCLEARSVRDSCHWRGRSSALIWQSQQWHHGFGGRSRNCVNE